MILKIKKNIYQWVTKQKKNRIGKMMYSFSSSLYEALENKNNDFNTNGEKWLIESLNSNSTLTIFDVGANIGEWSKLVCKTHTNVHVYAFEPIPQTFRKLSENTVNNNKISLSNFALGDSEKTIEMNFYPNESIFSSFFKHPLGSNNVEVIAVETKVGDDFCNINGIDSIDLLKIDVEGYESKVLFGFESMLKNKKIKMIQFEYGDLVLRSNFLLRDFYQFFEDKGYKVGKLYPDFVDFDTYNYKKENFLTSNFIAVISDISKSESIIDL